MSNENKYFVVVSVTKKEYYEVYAKSEEDAEWNYGVKGKKTSEKINEIDIQVYRD